MSNNALKEPERAERRAAGKCLYCRPGPGARDAHKKDGKTLTHCWEHLILNSTTPSKMRGRPQEVVDDLLAQREQARATLAAYASSKVDEQAQEFASQQAVNADQPKRGKKSRRAKTRIRSEAWIGSMPKNLCKKKLLEACGPRCWGCTQERVPELLVVAHLDPRNPAEGSGLHPGTDELHNVILLCGGFEGSPQCNLKMKDDMTLDQLREVLRERGMEIDTSHFPNDPDRIDWAVGEMNHYNRTEGRKEGRAKFLVEIIEIAQGRGCPESAA